MKGPSTAMGDEKGTVLAIAIFVTLLLFLQGVAFMAIAATENRIAHNEVNGARAFGVAEAGLAHSRRYLTAVAAVIDLDLLLGGSSGNPVPVAALQGFPLGAGQGNYSVSVANNTMAYQGIPADPDPENDTDNRIWVTAVGTYQSATQAVRGLVEVNPLLIPPAAITALNGPLGQPAEFEFNGNAFQVTGLDTLPPDLTATCGIPAADRTGIVVNSADSYEELDDEIGSIQEDNITGAGGSNSIAQESWISLVKLEDLTAALVQHATVTLFGSVTGNVGTPTAPVIAYATDPLDLQGNGRGYGILVAESSLRMRGNFTWEGLVLVVGQGEFEIEGTGLTGASVYGGVVVANTDNAGQSQVTVGGDPTVAFSRQALCRNWSIVPSNLLAWQQL